MEYILGNLHKDIKGLDVRPDARGQNDKTLAVCGMLINQTFEIILRELDSSPALAAKLSGADPMFRALADNIPMMMFFFMPLVAILMKLLYLFSGHKYVEHLLFLLHYHAAFFLLLTLMIIVSAFANNFPSVGFLSTIASTVSWIYIPVYLLVALRRVYSQSWLATNIKYLLLLMGYTITLVIAVATTAVYTALTL